MSRSAKSNRRAIPISVRLTLVFGVLVIGVLAAGLLAIDRAIEATLDESYDQELAIRWSDVTAAAAPLGSDSLDVQAAALVGAANGPAQAFSRVTGRRLATSLSSASRLASAAEVRSLATTTRRLARGSDDHLVRFGGRPSASSPVVVIAIDARARDDAEDALLGSVAIGAAIVFFIALLIAYLASRGSLAPVETLRLQAQTLIDGEEDQLLDVPRTRDELERLARTLNELISGYHDSLARERRFVADAGHELRTPIAAVAAEAELALENAASDPEARAAFTRIARSAARLCDLTDRLLILGGIGRAHLTAREQDVAAVVLDAVAEWSTASGRDSATPAVHTDGPCVAHVDSVLVALAVRNLLDNAERHGRLPVSVTVRTLVRELTIEVVDCGDGFDPSFVDRAAMPFSQDDESRAGAGAGLGLAIVADIARAHGGVLRIAHPVPASVSIVLPASPGPHH